MTTPTEPNFEQRITALEMALISEIDALIDGMAGNDPYKQMVAGIDAIQTVCAIARDYARRPEGEE